MLASVWMKKNTSPGLLRDRSGSAESGPRTVSVCELRLTT